MKSKIVLAAIPLFLCSPLITEAKPVNPAEQMLNYFSSTCPSQGAWTQAALGKASALVATLQAIQASPECNALIGSADRLNLLESQVQTIATMNSGTAQLLRNRNLEQKILFSLTTATDPAEVMDLKMRLTAIQLEITNLESDRHARNTLTAEDETRILTSIARNTDDFLIHASNSQACLLKNSSLLADLAKLTGGIVSTLTAVNPALSLGISGGTQLFSKVLDAARNHKLNRKIRKLNQANNIAAMSCVLESLSTDYCNADDAMRAIDWKSKHSSSNDTPPEGSLRSAIHLMDREVPAFLTWIESVRTSALVSTVADGERVKNFFERDAMLQGTLPIARGLFNQNAPVLNSIPANAGEFQHWTALKNILYTLMVKIGGSDGTYYGNSTGTVSNPIFNVYPQDIGMYYLVGIRQDLIPKQQGSGAAMTFSDFDAVTAWPVGVPKIIYDEQLLPTILARLTVWYRDASARLGSERLKIINPDALNTLASCQEKNWGEEKISACSALTKIRQFLDYRLKEPGMSLVFRRLHSETRDRLVKIEEQMKKLEQSGFSADDELVTILGQIYLQAQLDYGTFFLKGRFDSLLRIAFTDLFEQADPRDVDMAAESLASKRFMDALERVKAGAGTRAIREDISSSLTLSQTNLDKFTDTFADQIADVLEYLKKSEEKNAPAPGSTSSKAKSYRDDRAKICLNLLNVTTWPKKVRFSLCDGLNLQPLPPLGPTSETMSGTLLRSRPEQRMCKLQEIQKASDIFEYQKKR